MYLNKKSKSNDDKIKDIVMKFPIVYIHNWENRKQYEVYVDESNNIFPKTKQHLQFKDLI